MRHHIYSVLILLLISCNSSQAVESDVLPKIETSSPKQVIVDEIQPFIETTNSKGSVLIFKPSINTFYCNDYSWAKKGHLPASTFKIPNSIVALELGIVKNDSSMFYWDGEDQFQDRWERDLNFKEALKLSYVPCYLDIARKIGPNRMVKTLDKINYPGMVVDSKNIDMFWLEGESRITSFEQIDFLSRFYNNELPISENTTTA